MNTFHSGEMEFAAPPVAPQGKKKANQRPIVKVHPPSSAPHLQPARLLARAHRASAFRALRDRPRAHGAAGAGRLVERGGRDCDPPRWPLRPDEVATLPRLTPAARAIPRGARPRRPAPR